MDLPFIDTENDIHLNLSVVLLIISKLGKSNRGVLKLNNERLHIFHYLVKNPIELNKVLSSLGKGGIILQAKDAYSITSISPNLDPLFDRGGLKSILSILISKGLINVEFKKNDGFFYSINDKGVSISKGLNGDFFQEVQLICEKLKSVLSITESKLSQTLNQIIRKESI